MSDVEDFMARLAAQLPPAQKRMFQKSNEKKVDKIYLNFHGNFGRYQILPVDSVVTGFPYISLYNTYEICIPRTYRNQDGTEEVRNTWVKIVPKDGYRMKDQTGRIVPSLTNDEDTLLSQARAVFDELYKELDVKNNIDVCKDLIRKRNYTIFYGYCGKQWKVGNNRQPDKVNYPALFISTAKSFMSEVNKDIDEKKCDMGDESAQWIKGIYNRMAEGRSGAVTLTVNKSSNGVGFDIKLNHILRDDIKSIVIPKEDMDMMLDPMADFLGWQAKYEDETVAPENRRLFNSAITKEVIDFITSKLAALRSAKAAGNGMDLKTIIANAINVTTDAAVSGVQNTTNDPMLQQGPSVNVGNVQANNNQPFQTPPVFHADPTSGAPVNNGGVQHASPFTAPSFASFGNNQQVANNAPSDDLPF